MGIGVLAVAGGFLIANKLKSADKAVLTKPAGEKLAFFAVALGAVLTVGSLLLGKTE